jgi:hypothetical protein
MGCVNKAAVAIFCDDDDEGDGVREFIAGGELLIYGQN